MEVIKTNSIPGFNAVITKDRERMEIALDNKLKDGIIKAVIHSDNVDFSKVNKALKTITNFTIKWQREATIEDGNKTNHRE